MSQSFTKEYYPLKIFAASIQEWVLNTTANSGDSYFIVSAASGRNFLTTYTIRLTLFMGNVEHTSDGASQSQK